MAYRSNTRRRSSAPRPAQWMDLRYAGTCAICGSDLPAGTRAFYDPADRSVCCTNIDCAAKAGLTKDVWHGAPTTGSWVPVLSEMRIGGAS